MQRQPSEIDLAFDKVHLKLVFVITRSLTHFSQFLSSLEVQPGSTLILMRIRDDQDHQNKTMITCKIIAWKLTGNPYRKTDSTNTRSA